MLALSGLRQPLLSPARCGAAEPIQVVIRLAPNVPGNNHLTELVPASRRRPATNYIASGNGSALRPSARHDSVGKVLPSRQAFQALIAIATKLSRPESVEYWSR